MIRNEEKNKECELTKTKQTEYIKEKKKHNEETKQDMGRKRGKHGTRIKVNRKKRKRKI